MIFWKTSDAVKELTKIAETGLGSYIFSTIIGFLVGALPRQRDDFNFLTRSQLCGGETGQFIYHPPTASEASRFFKFQVQCLPCPD